MRVFIRPKGYINGANYRKITRYGNINYFSLHAEVCALLKYLKLFYKNSSLKQRNNKKNSSTIYIARVLRDKQNLPNNQNIMFGNCQPCQHCQEQLAKFGFKRIKYTDIKDGKNVLIELQLTGYCSL